MNLKEKLIEVANGLEKEANRYPRMKTIDVVNMLINISKMEFKEPKQCVQMCDEFSVGFQNFIDGNCMCLMIDGEYKGKRMLLQDQKYYTTTELLEIYKQGL